jgi:TonB family protein
MVSLFVLAASVAFANPAVDTDSNVVEQTKNGAFIFKKYPPRALAAGEQGTVQFRASHDKKGSVSDCEVTKSSGHRRLDAETCELIVRHARFKPELLYKGEVREGVQNGIVEWKIPGLEATSAVKTADAAPALPEKLICKRSTKPGSIILQRKQCLTKSEWEMQADEAKETIGDAQKRSSTRLQ